MLNASEINFLWVYMRNKFCNFILKFSIFIYIMGHILQSEDEDIITVIQDFSADIYRDFGCELTHEWKGTRIRQ